MIILAIDTSTEFCSVALASTSEVICEEERTGAQSSARALPMIQTVLDKADVALHDLAAIAFGAGPGSFTGIRTACALAQGLAFGANLPLIPIDTLLACAERTYQEAGYERVLVTLDARMGEVYWGEYYFDTHTWQILVTPSVSQPSIVQAQQTDYCVAGNASTLFPDAHFVHQAKNCLPMMMPRADYIGRLACHALMNGQALPPEQVTPIYVRNKVALTTQERHTQTSNKK